MATVISRDLPQFSSYRYPVTAQLVPAGAAGATGATGAMDLSTQVTGLRIVKDYDENVYPYYALSLLLSVSDYRRLQASWRQGKLYLTVGRNTLPVGGSTNDESPGAAPYMSSVEMQVLTAPTTPDGIPSSQVSDQALAVPRVGVVVECVPTSSLAVNKALNTTVYQGATPTDIVAHLASQNFPQGYTARVAPADNTDAIETAPLPPLSFANAVRYVDEVHGIYTGALQVFLDDSGALISSSAKTIGPPAGSTGPTRVVLEVGNLSSAGPELTVGSGYDPSARATRLRSSVPFDLDARGPAHQEADGEVLKLVNSSQAAPFSSDIQDVTATGDTLAPAPKQQVLWQGYDSPMQAAKIAAASRESYAPSLVVFHDPDLLAFDPTLPWTLQVGDAGQDAIQGDWRLSGVEVLLTRAPGGIGSCSAQVLARIKPAADGSAPP